MSKFYLILLVIVFIFGIFLRVYKFNKVPSSLNWDEVAIGWNAAAIWEAKIDQYGKRWPLSFKSYGDFKSPLLIYTTAIFVGIFGINDWTIRLPVLIISILSLFVFFLIAQKIAKLLEFNSKSTEIFLLINTLLLAISPWHIRFSRAAFEANFALFFILLGIYFLLSSLKNFYLIILSSISFIFSLYSYHSPKIFVPLFIISFLVIYRNKIIEKIKNHKIFSIITIIISLLSLYFLIKDTILGSAGERSGTLIFFENNKLIPLNFNLLKQILNNFWQHISPNFYIFGSDDNFRNNLKNIGLMPFIQYIYFLLGIITLFFKKNKISSNHTNILLLSWFFIGLLPGILSKPDSVPHTIRTLNALPAIILISSIGFINFVSYLKNKKLDIFENKINIYIPTLILIGFIFVQSQIFFYKEYFVNFPVYSAEDWQYGYKQVAQIAKKYEGEVDKIIITSKYGHPYLFFAFYQQRNPLYVIWGEMSKYQYKDNIEWHSDKFCKNCLIIGTGEELSQISEQEGKIIEDIHFPSEQIAFRIIKTY